MNSRPRQRQNKDIVPATKTQEVMEAALKLFSEKGYERTSMRDLAKATNLTTAGLYYYIQSKDELLNAVDKALFEQLSLLFERKRWHKDPLERLRSLMEIQIRTSVRRRDMVGFAREGKASKGFSEELKARRKYFVKKLEEFLRKVREDAGAKEDIDITLATFVLIGIVNWIPIWYREGGRINEDQLVEGITKFFARGFLNLP
jgi:TetR/AcrR family transcriptional regulator, cholesterol catabolism regulator